MTLVTTWDGEGQLPWVSSGPQVQAGRRQAFPSRSQVPTGCLAMKHMELRPGGAGLVRRWEGDRIWGFGFIILCFGFKYHMKCLRKDLTVPVPTQFREGQVDRP